MTENNKDPLVTKAKKSSSLALWKIVLIFLLIVANFVLLGYLAVMIFPSFSLEEKGKNYKSLILKPSHLRVSYILMKKLHYSTLRI